MAAASNPAEYPRVTDVTWVDSQKLVSSTATRLGIVSPALIASFNSYFIERKQPIDPRIVAMVRAILRRSRDSMTSAVPTQQAVMKRIVS